MDENIELVTHTNSLTGPLLHTHPVLAESEREREGWMQHVRAGKRVTYSMDMIRIQAHKLRFFRFTHGIGVLRK